MFKRANGLKYTTFMEGLHKDFLFDWYMEVGCRTGRIFANARGKTIAVDPFFQCETNVITAKPALHVFQQTSDDFFASEFLAAMKINLSFSFLDGMHLFEFLLRDVMAAERNSIPHGVIALHDCCPYDHEMTTRDLSAVPKRAWTGDVWKLIPILIKYRPDLRLTVLDAAPTGLVVISNLDPQSRELDQHYDEILSHYQTMTLERFGVPAFNALFDYTHTADFMAAGFPLFSDIQLPETFALNPQKITP